MMRARFQVPRSAATWAVIALVCTLLGLMNFSIDFTSHLAERDPVPAKYVLLFELTGAYSVLLLLPAVLWFIGRFPITRRDWWLRVPLHLAGSVVFGVCHTLIMWGSRILLFRLLDWGQYDYGDMRYRFLMEWLKVLGAYWLVYAVVALVLYVQANKQRELQAAELEQRLSEARLAALKMQLNPHFLFNTLNMISSHVYDRPALADEMLCNLSDFLRLTLRHSGRHEVPLTRELEFLGSYLEIMKARFQERLQVAIAVSAEAGQALVPHLILQPLVENAVTHCTSDHARGGAISVTAGVRAGRLRLCIEDNGPGIDGNTGQAPQRGVGLSNTAERLAQLYGDAHRLELHNLPQGGLQVLIEIPQRGAQEQREQ